MGYRLFLRAADTAPGAVGCCARSALDRIVLVLADHSAADGQDAGSSSPLPNSAQAAATTSDEVLAQRLEVRNISASVRMHITASQKLALYSSSRS